MEQAITQVFGFALVYRIVLMALLSSFMVITAYSFLNTRVKKKQEEYARTIRFLGIGDDQAALATRAVIDEYDGRSYVVPVATACSARSRCCSRPIWWASRRPTAT